MRSTDKPVRRSLSKDVPEIKKKTREGKTISEDDIRYLERVNNIGRAAVAMRDAGLSDAVITKMLQKHWEANDADTLWYIRWAHKKIPDKQENSEGAGEK